MQTNANINQRQRPQYQPKATHHALAVTRCFSPKYPPLGYSMKISKILIAVLAVTALWGCGSNEYRQASGAKWGTVYHVTYQADRDLGDSIVAEMSRVESSLSPFDENSIISAINRGENPQVDTLIINVFRCSQRVNAASGGMFDPTVGPLVELWGFGTDKSVDHSPSQKDIDAALATVGIDRCKIVDQHLVKGNVGTQFNFSAITKGYGADLVGEMLARNGVENYMVEIGGEIALRGHNPGGKPWRIQVDAPIADNTGATSERMAVVEITDCGIATSGNYRNYRDYDGQGRVGHTINPLTGLPVATTTLSATVIAPTCMEADALATACMALPAERAMTLIESWPGASALLVDTDEHGGLRMLTTPLFPELK